METTIICWLCGVPVALGLAATIVVAVMAVWRLCCEGGGEQ
jgi:hypothetical protein